MLFILFDPILVSEPYSTCIRPAWQDYKDCQINPALGGTKPYCQSPPARGPATTTTLTTTKPVTTTTTTHHPENTSTEGHSTRKAGKVLDKSYSTGTHLCRTLYFEPI